MSPEKTIEPHVGLRQFVSVSLEPRVFRWLAISSRSSSREFSALLAAKMVAGLTVLERMSPERVRNSLRRLSKRVYWSRVRSCTLDTDNAERLDSFVESLGQDTDRRAVAILAVKTVYLNAHPGESEVEDSRLVPEPNPLFRNKPTVNDNDIAVKDGKKNPDSPRSEIGGSANDPEVVALKKQLATTKGSGERSREKGDSASAWAPWQPSEEDEAYLALGSLFTKEEIRKYREDLGLSIAGLAKKLGVSRGLIYSAETGRRNGKQTMRRLTVGIRRLLDQKNMLR